MRIVLWAYQLTNVGMLGVTSLMMGALEIRAQNFHNLPTSNLVAYVLIWAPRNATVKHRPGPSLERPGSVTGILSV